MDRGAVGGASEPRGGCARPAGLRCLSDRVSCTAIHGAFAKPIVDILLITSNLIALDERNGRFRALGYEPKGEFGIPRRRYFRKHASEGVRTHQIHAFEVNSIGARRHFAFRDYMNAHPDAVKAYSALKRNLAATFPDDIQAYMDGKDAFVKRHEALALVWQSSVARGA